MADKLMDLYQFRMWHKTTNVCYGFYHTCAIRNYNIKHLVDSPLHNVERGAIHFIGLQLYYDLWNENA